MANLVGERPLNLAVEPSLFLVDRREVARSLLELSGVEIAFNMAVDIAASGGRLDDFEDRSARRRDHDRRRSSAAVGGNGRRPADQGGGGWRAAGAPLRLPPSPGGTLAGRRFRSSPAHLLFAHL